MDASVSFDSSCIVFTAEEAWFKQPRLRDATWWAHESGHLVPDANGKSRTLTLSFDDWNALGAGPNSDDPERIDAWRADHECVAKLLGIGEETIVVRAAGHVGGPRLRVEASINGNPLDLKRSSSPRFEDSSGHPVLVSPVASAALQELVAFAAREEHTRAEQLALIASLKRSRQLQETLGGAASRVRIHLDKHLESFEIIEPDRFALRWTDDGRNRVSLKLFVQGESDPLPLEDLDEDAPIIQRSARETIALDPGTEAVARRARKLQQVRPETVGQEALHNPLSLIPEGVETPSLDFSHYSHRILGFEPARAERAAFGYTSGTAWYQKDDDGGGRIILTTTDATGRTVQLSFETPEAATATADTLEAAVARGDTEVAVQGQQVRADPRVPQQLRDLIKRHYPEPDPLRDTAAGPDAPTADDDVPRSRARRLQAVLADVAAKAQEDTREPSDIESAVPWEMLARALKPDVALKPHQRIGIAWLWHRYNAGATGAILADDMGLGKTLQIACFLALVKFTRSTDRPKKPTLIIAPVVLIANWYEELTTFFRDPFPGQVLELRDERLRGLRSRDGELNRIQIEPFDIVITSYETLARYATSLLRINWDVVVLDEAQRIKNPGTQWSVAARGLSGLADPERPRKFDFGICATGTPVENSVADLWALYDFASPGSPFRSHEEFRLRYEAEPDAPRILGRELRIRSLTSSLLRRDKSEVLTDLPQKTYHTIPVPMTHFQRDQERVLTRRARLRGGGSFRVLEALQKLYQHPWLLDPEDSGGQTTHEQAIAASPKLAECIRLLEQIRELDEKVLVFTLWTRMQWLLKEVIEERLALRAIPILNGDPKHRKRAQEHIRTFSSAPGFAVMILSPLAAGVGLNITAANHVIHYGRWWNPAKEDQATDRAYRIGQQRPVHVYYPVLHHPEDPGQGFDIKLHELVSRKRAMARELLEPADHRDLTEKDLSELDVEGAQ